MPQMLVPAAEVVDGQVILARAVQPVEQVADVGLAPGRADPVRRVPLQGVDLDRRVELARLLCQPQLVPGVAVDLALGMLGRRLGTVGRVRVTADLQLQDLQVGAVARLEEVVEYLIALRARVLDQ